MIESKSIVLCVSDTSTSFVQTEIKNLANYFQSVTVFCFDNQKEITYKNVEFVCLDYNKYNTKTILFQNFFKITTLIIAEFFSKFIYIRHISIFKLKVSELLRSFYIARQIEIHIAPNQLYMSYWFDQWATVLSILKYHKKIPFFYSRAHGTDVYEERVPFIQSIPFRMFQLQQVKKVFSVSQKGLAYLQEKYPAYKHKIALNYLGTDDFGLNTDLLKTEIFTIVSCAKIRNIKRIYLLAEVLTNISFPVKWIHIGGENKGDSTLSLLQQQLEVLKTKSNIVVDFKGDLSNEVVHNLYNTEWIDAFVSVSETEGLPVSMMEAISHGIPIISTDVGGCNEIVNGVTGTLVRPEINATELAMVIEIFSKSATNFNRNNIKEIWAKKFNNQINFKSLVALINE